ncbi:MAG TPA: Ig-like domain-containing protein [Pyrinomonadaceae bacterium]|nr:Ig-like domain-containing protein [Pyrinomonadaceae bacterium]
MRSIRILFLLLLPTITIAASAPGRVAQQTSETPKASAVKTVEITPATLEAEVGQQVKFAAVAKDAAGKPLSEKPSVWVAAPFDLAAADESGLVSFYNPGEVQVLAIVGGVPGFAKVTVKPMRVAVIDVAPVTTPIMVGGTIQLHATPRTSNGNPRQDLTITWSSDDLSVATVDAAGLVTGVAPGKARLRASADGASGVTTITVVKSTLSGLLVEPRSTSVRTGDVVRFKAQPQGAAGQAGDAAVRWTVSGEGATIEPDGGFVAERPGTYIVTATSGGHISSASVVVAPRNVERDIKVVGRAPVKDFMAAEQWVFGNHAYLSTVSDKLLVYDISDPAHPKLTDTVKVDARHINDVSTTADGRIAVITREGASNRKNGIVFLDTSDPAHPKIISEYTATVTGGVHSAFIDGHYVYLTDDATGSMRVIDFSDVKAPKEVARWQVENPIVNTVRTPEGEVVGGRYLHDVQVKDGLAYLAYWRDGLIILDVGNGIKGGSPEKPQLVSQARFNYYELYGNGWLAGAHAVFRYKNYVFVGDEVFPAIFDLHSKRRIPVRGIIHVVDVSDIERPRKVAEYPVPEAGAHNVWVKDDILYMGYYNGGGRILDVSGELRGDLYRQGREIARIWTGDPEGFRPNIPFTWGAQPHKDLIFFNDMNTGLWIVKLGEPVNNGMTTAPAN